MARILIAEDDNAMRNFLSMALEKAGHHATACEDGASAFNELNKNPQDYDLLLADIIMPGMDGIELSKKAVVLNPAIKIMFITGFAAIAQRAEQQDTKLLSKPFHLKDLVGQIEEMLAA